MAYIVGVLSEDEAKELERRGWDLEPAPAGLEPPAGELAPGFCCKLVFVDTSMFDVMSGPDWEKG